MRSSTTMGVTASAVLCGFAAPPPAVAQEATSQYNVTCGHDCARSG